MKFTCTQNIENIMLYVEGEMNDSQRIAFEAHMKTCQQCRQAVNLMQETRTITGSAARYTPSLSASANTKAAIYKAANQQRFIWPRRIAFAGVVACAVTASFLVWKPINNTNRQHCINQMLLDDHTSWQNSRAFSDPALVEISSTEHL